MILIHVGLVLMVIGTLKTVLTKEFKNRLHTMGVSDTAGSILVLLGMALEGFNVSKMILGMVFILIWSPLITHTLAKAYTSRLRR